VTTHHDVPPLVQLSRVSVTRNGCTLIRNLSWSLRAGERWAILGRNGAGKSTFLCLARGDIWPDRDGCGERLFCLNGRPEKSPLEFRRLSSLCSTALLAAYRRHGLNLNVQEVLASGLFDSLRPHVRLTPEQRHAVHRIAAELDLTSLLDRSMLELSNGQSQMVLLARAMVKDPAVLFLDEIGDSLDEPARYRLQEAVQTRVQSGAAIVWATHRPDSLALASNDQMLLQDGQQTERVAPLRKPSTHGATPEHSRQSPRGSSLLEPHRGPRLLHKGPTPSTHPAEPGEAVIRIDQADVVLHGRPVLRDLCWTIRRHEHWAVSGPNGSGKSTLFRLILGQVHPLPGGSIQRFNRDRVPIRDIRQRIGHFSPDLEAWHTSSQSGLETVLSGLFGHIGLNRPVTKDQRKLAMGWLRGFGLAHLADRDIRCLSCGELRLLLLLRAVIHEPELLLVDEPCSGLDTVARQGVLNLLNDLAWKTAQLIMISHREEDFPACLQKKLILGDGAVQGIVSLPKA